MIKWEQMVFLGNPEYGVSLEPIDFVKFAEACGARRLPLRASRARCGPRSRRCCSPTARRCARRSSIRSSRRCRRASTAKQALHMAEALAKGEPNRGRIALTLFRDKIVDLKR